VLCEKPLAISLDDAKAMIKVCDENNVRFATNHHLRWAATHQAIRAAIEAGKIGEVRSARVFHAVYLPPHLQGWRIDNPAAGGGVVLDITVHNCDILAYLLGEYPQEVVSMTDHKLFGDLVEDEAMSVWRYPSGVLAYTHESFATPHAGHGIEIHGSEGSLFGESVMSQQPVGTVYLQRNGEREELAVNPHNLYQAGVADFIAAINEGRAPACDGIAGTRSLAVALAVLESAKSGNKVSVDYAGV
jgi:1,5-anhydro-D-fructose reductase (1,5-anhydro-D-mannitol-forming)